METQQLKLIHLNKEEDQKHQNLILSDQKQVFNSLSIIIIIFFRSLNNYLKLSALLS